MEPTTDATALDPTRVDADELARNLGQASDQQLAGLMAGPMRERILGEIFRRMAEHLRADSAADVEAVIHWRIGGRADGGADEYETVIRGGACEAHEGFRSEPRVSFAIDGADFLKLVTGNAAGPALFVTRRLKVDGDLMFAASAASLFTIPNS